MRWTSGVRSLVRRWWWGVAPALARALPPRRRPRVPGLAPFVLRLETESEFYREVM